MRAYWFDDVAGDARAPHELTDTPLPANTLASLGVLHQTIPVPTAAGASTEEQLANPLLDPVSRARDYKHRDVITISPRHMGEAYKGKIDMFFEEHMHEDEEARYILEGSGYFDVRDASDARWVRICVERGDLIVLPAGVYHRFTPDQGDFIQAMRLFKDEPKWTPLNRGESTEANKHRLGYVSGRTAGFGEVLAVN